MIEKPGIYLDFPTADYYADPAPVPSLTQSIAKVLLDKSPLHAWHAHPRLNPDYLHDDDRKFDVGNVAHAMMIGRGKAIEVLEYDDWRTKAAKEAREAAAAAGRLAILGKHAAKAGAMVAAAREQLELRGLGHLFAAGQGDGEVVLAWPERRIWCRQMVDWLTSNRLIFADYKTTDQSAAPFVLGRKMVADGWPIQAAMGERGLDVLHPESAGRRRYLFIVQETERPYALNVVQMSEIAMTMGRKQLQAAVTLWTQCVQTDRWRGYPTEVIIPEYPSYAETQWLEREMTEFSEPAANILMAG
jgi:hypothetical protein